MSMKNLFGCLLFIYFWKSNSAWLLVILTLSFFFFIPQITFPLCLSLFAILQMFWDLLVVSYSTLFSKTSSAFLRLSPHTLILFNSNNCIIPNIWIPQSLTSQISSLVSQSLSLWNWEYCLLLDLLPNQFLPYQIVYLSKPPSVIGQWQCNYYHAYIGFHMRLINECNTLNAIMNLIHK